MTFEELKTEAKAQGYNLVKIRKKEKLLPCVCGCTRRTHAAKYTDRMYIKLTCCKCGLSAQGTSDDDAIRNWNKMIMERSE